MHTNNCDMCGKELKCGLASPIENEGREDTKSTIEIRILKKSAPNEQYFKILDLCESCHYRLMDFIERSIPRYIYTTLVNDEKTGRTAKT